MRSGSEPLLVVAIAATDRHAPVLCLFRALGMWNNGDSFRTTPGYKEPTMTRPSWILLVLLGSSLTTAALSQEKQDISTKYKALQCPQPTLGTTWAIVERDGANRKVDPYLSSLGQGETGTGTISSPSFVIDTDTIRFTICGHDGQPGGRGENYIALDRCAQGQGTAEDGGTE